MAPLSLFPKFPDPEFEDVIKTEPARLADFARAKFYRDFRDETPDHSATISQDERRRILKIVSAARRKRAESWTSA